MPKSPDQRGYTTVWTIQHQGILPQLEQSGALRGSEEWVREDFRTAYKWIMGQMEKRIPDYKGGWPIWAWVRFDRERNRPDLREKGYLPKGDPGVLIEACVPNHLHLPHDFTLWETVLYNEYLALNREESDAWDAREYTIPLAQREEEKQKNWETIFDLTGKGRDWRWLGSIRKNNPIETVIEEIRKEWIVSLQYFTAR